MFVRIFIIKLIFYRSENEVIKEFEESLYYHTDNILCRECGTQLLVTDAIISKISAASTYSFNDTIFNRNEILVQLLIKDIFIENPIITSSDCSCLGEGDWEDHDLWFPGYAMKPCFCPNCGTFVGWMFNKYDNTTEVNSFNQFFGLILPTLIGENFTNSLIKYPKI